jgi:hypothetical protein
VWVDDQDYPLRVDIEYATHTLGNNPNSLFGPRVLTVLFVAQITNIIGANFTSSSEIHFHDFGAPVEISVPDEFTPLEEGNFLWLGPCPGGLPSYT